MTNVLQNSKTYKHSYISMSLFSLIVYLVRFNTKEDMLPLIMKTEKDCK